MRRGQRSSFRHRPCCHLRWLRLDQKAIPTGLWRGWSSTSPHRQNSQNSHYPPNAASRPAPESPVARREVREVRCGGHVDGIELPSPGREDGQLSTREGTVWAEAAGAQRAAPHQPDLGDRLDLGVGPVSRRYIGVRRHGRSDQRPGRRAGTSPCQATGCQLSTTHRARLPQRAASFRSTAGIVLRGTPPA